MALPVIVNMALMTVSSVASAGLGDLTLDAAADGYQTFADAGVSDADVVRYVIREGAAWEIGSGVYTASGTTLARTLLESSTGSLVAFTSAARVYVAATASDFYDLVEVSNINADTSTALTLALTDRGHIVTMDNAAANEVTIPAEASVDFPVGSVVTVIQIGAGVTTITGDTGVTVNSVSAGSGALLNRYQGVSLLKIAADSWIASGDIATVA